MPSRPIEDDLPRNLSPIVPKNSIAGHALAAVVAIMTFLASLTTGAVMLVLSSAAEWQSDVAREMTIQIRPLPGHDIEAEVAKAARDRPGDDGRDRRAALHTGGIGATARALARHRASRSRICRSRASSWCAPPASCDRISPRCAPPSPPRSPAPASTIIAAGSTACARWPAAPIAGGIADSRAGPGGDGAVGGVRHPRRHGDQSPHRRGPAFHRRQERLHRRAVPGPFPRPRIARAAALAAAPRSSVLAVAGLFGDWFLGTAASDQSAALFGNVLDRNRPAISSVDRPGHPRRGGDGVDLAAGRQPDPRQHRLSGAGRVASRSSQTLPRLLPDQVRAGFRRDRQD